MEKIPAARNEIDRILYDTERAIQQIDETLAKGEKLPDHFRNKFNEIQETLSSIQSREIKADPLQFDNTLKVINALLDSKKIPDLLSHLNSVKNEILLLKEKAKIKRGGKVELDEGGGYGSR